MKKIGSLILLCLLMVACNKEPQPEEVMDKYIKAWNKQNFSEMYEQLSEDAKSQITKEEFTSHYNDIYKDMEVSEVQVKAVSTKEDKKNKEKTALPYKAQLKTLAGEISFKSNVELVKEKEDKTEVWRIAWTPALIFPAMKEDDRVQVKPYIPKRGDIVDPKGNILAGEGTVYEIGLVLEKMGENHSATKQRLSQLLEMSVDEIDKKLSEKWVKPHLLVPLTILSDEASHAELLRLPGVKITDKKMRVYPLKEAAAHVTGYIGEITAEELQKTKGYQPGDKIGKRGLEQVYEDKLKGQKGARIYIVDRNKKEKEVLADKPAKDGETVTVTIDTAMQQALYTELKDNAGTASAINPQTGEILALVSTPAFNPNDFVQGMKAADWNVLNDNLKQPLLNRFTQAYTPGSVFKPITAVIGMNTGTLNPKEEKQITGLQWAKDGSWGNYFVTRVKEASPIDLETALVYSDNIYFAQEALKVGTETFSEEAKKFGFGEKLPLAYPFQESKLAVTDIKNDIQLADTAYGQGEVLMTPLHVALSYAPFITRGSIPAPSLQKGENEGMVWKDKIMSEATAMLVHNSLIRVIDDPEGIGRAAKIDGARLAGKTGTAELKKAKRTEGQENGWFVAYDEKKVVVVMIEDVKTRGGSNYVVAKVKRVFDNEK
ncbi:penicillin-binding transpeptidase domain-containing protein [Ectobacillus sp. JY-23]|uniref:penicillin-binding transpeptidase domain-containing protein n=1 Tax=Ectobacillus sp. JY-23 TaxID=2933872 RepID=UPI001FF5E0E0|nr:penicillin-binding transpeptidase domain-containing protein [Ectobacillus sp. JY-23]UOY92857.1 penicillin-binding transpeptidase domain-containing protein [Ectobacillus sp. JY-23]